MEYTNLTLFFHPQFSYTPAANGETILPIREEFFKFIFKPFPGVEKYLIRFLASHLMSFDIEVVVVWS